MADHTKGPWVVDDGNNVFGGGRIVANCGGYQTNIGNSHMAENEANASLVAAAPELLGVLELIVADGVNGHITNKGFNKARRAIARANGE